VRKAQNSRGECRETKPTRQTVAPAGSSLGGRGGNETIEALGEKAPEEGVSERDRP
jgi:hypothetical protein